MLGGVLIALALLSGCAGSLRSAGSSHTSRSAVAGVYDMRAARVEAGRLLMLLRPARQTADRTCARVSTRRGRPRDGMDSGVISAGTGDGSAVARMAGAGDFATGSTSRGEGTAACRASRSTAPAADAIRGLA